jgi:signal transduction histidine kinase
MRRGLSLRAQLTLLYAVAFVLSGTVLVSVPLLQFSESVPVNSPLPPPTSHSPATPDDQNLIGVLLPTAIALVVMVVIAGGLGWYIAGRFLRPLRTITATARDISATNLHRRLDLRGRSDEFRDLAQTLDELFARLEASFASQRHFVANASHELRTPLTAERALMQVALADPHATVDSLRAACEEVLALSVAQECLIESLLTLATGERGLSRREPVDLAAVAQSAVTDASGVRTTASLDPATVLGDPSLVASLVANLVSNAVRHNVPDGSVTVSTAGTSLTVSNTGPVVPPADVARLFQPFQQLGDARVRHGDGHGLGLAIVHAIATAHGATVTPTANPAPGGGLTIIVAFPS